jgi:hypothetical protein
MTPTQALRALIERLTSVCDDCDACEAHSSSFRITDIRTLLAALAALEAPAVPLGICPKCQRAVCHYGCDGRKPPAEAPAASEPTPPVPTMTDAAEMLWVVLANVSGGDWTKQSAEWREAAARWRDNYFAAVKAIGKWPVRADIAQPAAPEPAASLAEPSLVDRLRIASRRLSALEGSRATSPMGHWIVDDASACSEARSVIFAMRDQLVDAKAERASLVAELTAFVEGLLAPVRYERDGSLGETGRRDQAENAICDAVLARLKEQG